MVPFYLLQVESDQYPVYVDNSNIDESLTRDFKICSIDINMSESVKETLESYLKKMMGNYGTNGSGQIQNSFYRQRSVMQKKNSNVHSEADRTLSGQIQEEFAVQVEVMNISLKDISLLTTADKLIKMCEKKVEKNQKNNRVQFSQNSSRKQILKFKNKDSYLYGETQLIYFVEIRQFLRSKEKDLELVFISLNVSDMQNNFDVGKGSQHQNIEFPPILQVNPSTLLDHRSREPSMLKSPSLGN